MLGHGYTSTDLITLQSINYNNSSDYGWMILYSYPSVLFHLILSTIELIIISPFLLFLDLEKLVSKFTQPRSKSQDLYGSLQCFQSSCSSLLK